MGLEPRGCADQGKPEANPTGEEPLETPKPKVKPFEIDKRLVYQAWEKVRANHGAPGVDAVSIKEFSEHERDNLYKLWNRMSSGSYFPGPVRAVEIPKDHGKGVRVLGVPNTADRIAQTAAAMLLEAAVEPIFHPDSYGYRPGRDCHQALAVTRKRCWDKDWVLDLDIRAFFDSVPHDLLLKAVARHTSERWVLLYIERWLKAPMQMRDGTLAPREKGTPQGSPISPVLANLFMHYAFDRWMGREFPGCQWERYADDVVAHCDTEEQAQNLRAAIAERLRALGLELHPEKTKVVFCKDANRQGEAGHTSFDYLGYTFRARLAKGPQGYFAGFSPGHLGRGEEGERPPDQGLAPRSSNRDGPVQHRPGDQPSSAGLGQLLRSLLPLRVALPCVAHQRAACSLGHAQVQTVPQEVPAGDGVAAAGLPPQPQALRPLETRCLHCKPACGGRMTGDCHVRS